jgi:hypothetical protein
LLLVDDPSSSLLLLVDDSSFAMEVSSSLLLLVDDPSSSLLLLVDDPSSACAASLLLPVFPVSDEPLSKKGSKFSVCDAEFPLPVSLSELSFMEDWPFTYGIP